VLLFSVLWVVGWPREAAEHTFPGEQGFVAAVIDGDTIELADGRRVRLIGIDTPEIGDCYASEATARIRELLLGRTVRLVRDVSAVDPYGRALRYVYIEDTFVNHVLVAEGYARSIFIRPDTAQYSELRIAQEEARDAGRGLWSVCR
jgi:micrococcal nuclease